MPHYAALDVSNEQTAIHVIDEAGRTVWRGKRASDPEALAEALRRHAPDLVRVGLETGFLTPWLYHSLKAVGLPVVCIEARHARAATALQRNKTDANDAETLAQLVRTGWYREARVKTKASPRMRCATWSAPGPRRGGPRCPPSSIRFLRPGRRCGHRLLCSTGD
jgi:transposase